MRLGNLANKRRSFMTTIVESTDPLYNYLITGTSGSNIIWGDPYGPSRDNIKGLAGNDTLHGGDQNDRLEGGSGADMLDGGGGSDKAPYSSSPAAVEIHLTPGAAAPHGGEATGDTLISIENLSGSQFDDLLFGDTHGNILTGNGGNDKLVSGGSAGYDALDDDVGYDTLDGGAGNDQLYGGAGIDLLHGGAGNDHLEGGAGSDILGGYAGNDHLEGGAGSDYLNGGAGIDHFYFWTADSGDVDAGQADGIWDFKDEDTIFLKGSYTYAGNTAAPADGQYSIWQHNGNWVVTWNAVNDNGYHDVTVQGDNPAGDISFF
jgi:Ca2+-binding RTX toxin-like protein